MKIKKFKLFQLKRSFWRSNSMSKILKRDKIQVNLNNYVVAYEGEIEQEGSKPPLEELFYKFNMDYPENFEGRSMSVSDIIFIDNKYYFCDSIGWEKLEL
ncbi:YodL domain-containing protein [Exiguobacterium sp. s133]|uniref:YodL domain-containing protein n=1 Tax=Exiguobacterium sp. s133 TaxID=2751213 RepID=UPI001BE569AD|nr:YodL domain-containing protein [Exiguobacterium sp. s133]